MLPKCCHNLSGAPLMMLILIKYHLELKKGVSNVIIEDLGGWRGRNVADFLGDLNQTHIASKTKKIRYMYPESTKIRLFSNFMMIFAYITSIFVGLEICLKVPVHTSISVVNFGQNLPILQIFGNLYLHE